MPTTTTTTEEVMEGAYVSLPPGFTEMDYRDWRDRVVPALLAARATRGKRQRARALIDAGEVIAAVVEERGGLSEWNRELLLYRCADLAGVGLPITAADLRDDDDPWYDQCYDDDDTWEDEFPDLPL